MCLPFNGKQKEIPWQWVLVNLGILMGLATNAGRPRAHVASFSWDFPARGAEGGPH